MKNFTNNFKQFTSRLSARWLIMALMLLVGTSSAWAQKYNYHWKGKVYFVAPETWDLTNYSYVQVNITRTTSATASNHQEYVGSMTRLGTSRMYYLVLDANHSNWGQNEYLAFTANDHAYNSGSFALNGNHYYTKPISYDCNNSDNYYLFKPNAGDNYNTVTGTWGENRDILKAAQTVQICTNGNSSASGGKVTLKGYYFSADNSITQSTATSTSATETYNGAVIGSEMTLTASANTGYEFDGWYNAASDGTLLSSSATYTYNVYEAKTIYARFTQSCIPPTLSFDNYSIMVTSGTVVNLNEASGAEISGTGNIVWYSDSGCTDVVSNPTSVTYTGNSDKYYYAKAVGACSSEPKSFKISACYASYDGSTYLYFDINGSYFSEANAVPNVSFDGGTSYKDAEVYDAPNKIYRLLVPEGCYKTMNVRRHGSDYWNLCSNIDLSEKGDNNTFIVGDNWNNCEYSWGQTQECTTPNFSVELSNATVTKGDENIIASITVTDSPAPAVAWTSSDETVATIDADGNITAIKEGQTNITATTTGDDGFCEGVEKTATLTVKSPITTVTLEHANSDGTFKAETPTYCVGDVVYFKLTHDGSPFSEYDWTTYPGSGLAGYCSNGSGLYHFTITSSGTIGISLRNDANVDGEGNPTWAESNLLEFNTHPEPTAPYISIDPASGVLCEGYKATITVTNPSTDCAYKLVEEGSKAVFTDYESGDLKYSVGSVAKYYVAAQHKACRANEYTSNQVEINQIISTSASISIEPATPATTPWEPVTITVNPEEGYVYELSYTDNNLANVDGVIIKQNGDSYTYYIPRPNSWGTGDSNSRTTIGYGIKATLKVEGEATQCQMSETTATITLKDEDNEECN